jgi:cholesterol transport system auxiliary component
MTRAGCFLAASLLLLSSCGGILPAPPPPPLLFRLTPLVPAPAAAKPIAVQLVVDPPAAPAALDTPRIALARSPTTLDYFADAAWTDRAPLMLQGVMVESLENAGQIRVVARQASGVRADLELICDLAHFEAVYGAPGPPLATVALDCRLVTASDRSVIAVRSFAASVRAAANETPAIVTAFDDAFHTTMGEIAPWVAANAVTRPAR